MTLNITRLLFRQFLACPKGTLVLMAVPEDQLDGCPVLFEQDKRAWCMIVAHKFDDSEIFFIGGWICDSLVAPSFSFGSLILSFVRLKLCANPLPLKVPY